MEIDIGSDDRNALGKPTPEDLRQLAEFADVLNKEAEVRTLEAEIRQAKIQSERHLREIELRNQNDRNKRSHEFGMASLKMEVDVVNQHAKWRRRESTKRYLFSAFIILVGIVAIGYLVHIGQTTFAEKILQIGAGLLGGTGIGYAFGFRKGKDSRKEDDED